MNKWGVHLQNVSSRWSNVGVNILEGINFTFSVSNVNTAMLPLIGPTGQGKSTLLCLLAALKLPTTGKITWQFPEDKEKYTFDTAETVAVEKIVQLRRTKFGFAFQDSTLSPHLTISENIAYPLLSQGESWQNAIHRVNNLFEQVLLDSEKKDKERLLHSLPSQLSGGQRQRAALAQAIVHDPCVVFADEPTGQLDRHTRKQVMEVLKQWVIKGRGKRCLIWVTHHDVDDLEMMGTNHLLFVKDKQCTLTTRQWLLEQWGS